MKLPCLVWHSPGCAYTPVGVTGDVDGEALLAAVWRLTSI
jgi:hypothetical protein